MGVFTNFLGTMKSIFHIGGPNGNAVKNELDGVSVRNAGDTDYANARVKAASGSVDEHAVNWRDLLDANTLISFSFDGGTPPAAGANTGAYGICHTSGGVYSEGQVYYDDGTQLRPVKLWVGATIVTGSAVVGNLNMIANGVYAAHSASAPFSWTLKGDGGAGDIGMTKRIRIPIDTAATKTSTTSIPAGSIVYEVETEITTPYDNGAQISVAVDGAISDLTIQPADEIDPATAGLYHSSVEGGEVIADTEGPVTVTITNTPAAGAGFVNIKYAENLLG